MKSNNLSKKEYNKEYYLKNRERIEERMREYRLKNRKYIKEYNKEYYKEYYLKNRERIEERRKEYYLKNRKYIKEQHKEYYLKNREYIREQKKEYNLKNRERRKEYMRGYNLKRKEYNKEYARENIERTRNYERNKYQTDNNFRLKKICRTRIRTALKGIAKPASTMKLIGCTIEELWAHLESCKSWEPWMTRENYGLWDVDHIIACAKFNLIDPAQQRMCFHYTNLQPLEHIANMRKGAR